MLARARSLWKRLTPAVPGARVVKSGIVVALVWGVAQSLGQERPMFAVFAALGALQPTIRSSVLHLVGVLAGVLTGSLLALAMATTLGGPAAATMGVAVILALMVGYRLAPATSSLGAEVLGTTVLTVAFANGQPSWIAERLLEVAGGGVLALVVNALVLPPDFLGDVKSAVHQLADELALGVRHAIDDLVHRPSRDEVRQRVLEARASRTRADELVAETDRALEALRFSPLVGINPVRRIRRDRVERYGKAVKTLAAMVDHARAAQRAAWQTRGREALDPAEESVWLLLADSLEVAIRAFEACLIDGDRRHDEASEAVRAARDVYARVPGHDGQRSGALLDEIEHVLDDLANALPPLPVQPRSVEFEHGPQPRRGLAGTPNL
jgi:hypothetical protein